jgi:hypothetical protein
MAPLRGAIGADEQHAKMPLNIMTGRQWINVFLGAALNFSLIFSCEAAELYKNVRVDTNGQLHIRQWMTEKYYRQKEKLRLVVKRKSRSAFRCQVSRTIKPRLPGSLNIPIVVALTYSA